ncbi:hypothetical protein J3F83DRAFT_716776 [Trichoderma novae-zelandiae]
MDGHGDLNNTHAARVTAPLKVDSEYENKSFAISVDEDEAHIRKQYRPFLLPETEKDDWVAKLELATTLKMVEPEILDKKQPRLRLLVNGGSQSFNAVNSLRMFGHWMRMFTIPNQSSVPQAYAHFTSEEAGSRMKPSSNRDRLVDCMEELVKYTIVMRPHFELFGDRYSEREETGQKENTG